MALGFTLVFFIVFFNVLQGVREVSPTVLNGTRMLGASRRQLLRHVYLPAPSPGCSARCTSPSAWRSWARSSPSISAARRGVGYLILQAEGVFDVDTVFAGIVVLTACALVLDACVSLAEKRLLVWQPRADTPRDT